MVGHDDKGVQAHIGILLREPVPSFLRDFAVGTQVHNALLNASQATHPALHTTGEKIAAIAAVVVSGEAVGLRDFMGWEIVGR